MLQPTSSFGFVNTLAAQGVFNQPPRQNSLDNLERQRSFEKERQRSIERFRSEAERQQSWELARQRSLERSASISKARSMARGHSFTFFAGDNAAEHLESRLEKERARSIIPNGRGTTCHNAASMAQGSQFMGSCLADGSELANATQLAGAVCSISGGSIFLTQAFADPTVRVRVGRIPRHTSSTFVEKNYRIVKELGKGAFSRVQLLCDRRNRAPRVLKISEGGMGTNQSRMLKNEIQVLSTLDHPCVVRILEYSEDIIRLQLLLVLEFAGGGDCQQLIKSGKPQREPFITKLIWQLLSALCYCHARGILHCDIKPENMMLTKPTASTLGTSYPDCKLIDFGLAHTIEHPTMDFIGTPSYMALEIVKGTAAYTVKADIWSVGVTACELLALTTPFGTPRDYKGNMEPVLQNIRNYSSYRDIENALSYSASWPSRSSSAKQFVKSLIVADPAQRPHADEAIEHGWFATDTFLPNYLQADLLGSMRMFIGASDLIRRCLLIIATRVGSAKMGLIGQMFLSIDAEHKGNIGREDLAAAVGAIPSCWEPEIDVDDFFDIADQEGRGSIGFSEFAATCLWDYDVTTCTIAETTFTALDEDHDGLVHLDDCRHLFRDCDLVDLKNLPMHRGFGINEWRLVVGGDYEEAPMRKKDIGESWFAGLVRGMLCSSTGMAPEEDDEVIA